eukprot:TRINITY_DN6153_c0_g1_i1.p1 TRINITY_DN6153_c0_g1~~TRINITY_DN6153_c0_g1_i1.p1  ORF type:complete len:177 (-),score=24.58 TRINITY_DN6153_c0_g1_i1:212-742(-)
MNKFLLFATLLLSATAVNLARYGPITEDVVEDTNWSSCGDSSYKLTVTSLTFTPNPPVVGQDVTIVAVGSSSENINGGNIHINLAYGPIVLLNNSFPLCSMISGLGVSCPLTQGPHTFKVQQNIPNGVPTGQYTAQVTAVDDSGNNLVCVNANFTLGGGSSFRKPTLDARRGMPKK